MAEKIWAAWHVTGVCAAVTSAVVALTTTEYVRSLVWFHVAAWSTRVVAGAILLVDEFLEMRSAKARRAPGGCSR